MLELTLQLALQLALQSHNCVYHNTKAPQDFDIKKIKKKRKETNSKKNITIIKNKEKHVDKDARKNGVETAHNP